MSNKYPQYYTTTGLERRKKKPSSSAKSKPLHLVTDQHEGNHEIQESHPVDQTKKKGLLNESQKAKSSTSRQEITLVTTPAKKIDRKRKMIKRASDEPKTISPAAAKAIAEALKSMLHS